MLQIITDSSADLPALIIEKYNIHVVPLTIIIDGKEYTEGIDLTPLDFYQKMLNSPALPKTSQPSPLTFARIFEELSSKGHLLCLTLSSKLSGTYQAACLGNDISGGKATVFDTLAGSLGHGLQIIKAAELAAQVLPIEKIVEKLKIYRDDMNIFILLDTLDNIVKGGRLNKFSGMLAKVLDMKILLHNVEGAVEMLEKIRGKKKFLLRVIDYIGERKEDFSECIFGITHVDNLEDAELLKKAIIEKYHPKGVIINYMGSTMGTYAGKNGIILSF